MTKKVLAILCGLVLTTAFVGCVGEEDKSGTPSTTETVTVTYMIDDFEDSTEAAECDVINGNNGENVGSWFSWTAGAGAEINPAEDQFCTALEATGGAGDEGGYLAISGTSAGDGIGVGAYFNLSETSGLMDPVDFSAHSGLVFWAKGSATVSISLNMPELIPAEESGLCDPAANPGWCYNYNSVTVNVDSQEWVEYSFPWSEFKMADWGEELMALDPANISSIHFNFPGTAGDVILDVDQLGFYTEE
jgi:hypothetical protein